MKRKYLHVEIIDGILYIYCDNEIRDGETITVEQMNEECDMGNVNEFKHYVIDWK